MIAFLITIKEYKIITNFILTTSEVSAFDPSTLPTCPGAEEVYTSRTGTIDYPEGNHRYQNNLNCKFTIKAQANQSIKFKFSEFDFEGNYVSQNYDWLKIYDGNNRKIGEYAMSEKPPTDWKQIESNLLFIHMKTDHSTQKKGFVMEWEFKVTDCGCNETGTVRCDQNTGVCKCKANVVGAKCDSCRANYWNFPGIVTNSSLIQYLKHRTHCIYLCRRAF